MNSLLSRVDLFAQIQILNEELSHTFSAIHLFNLIIELRKLSDARQFRQVQVRRQFIFYNTRDGAFNVVRFFMPRHYEIAAVGNCCIFDVIHDTLDCIQMNRRELCSPLINVINVAVKKSNGTHFWIIQFFLFSSHFNVNGQ